jgi:hypothetical protein
MSVVNSVHRAEIEKRHARRIDIEKEAKKLKPPSIHSKASKSDFQKVVNGLTEKFSEECLMVTHDFKVLIMAFNLMQIMGMPVDEYIDSAWFQCPMSAELQEAIDVRAYEETEARQKAAKNDKRNGELEGQQKIPFDDGSEPEAGECVTTRCDADGNPLPPPTFDEMVDGVNRAFSAEPDSEAREIGGPEREIPMLPDWGPEGRPVDVLVISQEDLDAQVAALPVLPGREITDEEVDQLGGKNITDEQLDADIAKAQSELDKSPSFVAPELAVSELAERVAKKKAAAASKPAKAKAKK